MQRIRSEALLLRSVDFGESDRIVHLLTPAGGRLTAMAKGARRSVKRFSGTLDLFNHLEVWIVRPRRASMARLEQAKLRSAFLGVRRHPGRFALACYLFELLDRMAPEGGARRDMQRLFAFAHAALQLLERETPDNQARVLLELKALEALGLRPELRVCVRCGRAPDSARIGFDVADGGVVCGACASRSAAGGLVALHLGTARALEHGLQLPLDRLSRLAMGPGAVEEARQLLHRFHRFHLGLELRSEPVLDKLLQAGAHASPAQLRQRDNPAGTEARTG